MINKVLTSLYEFAGLFISTLKITFPTLYFLWLLWSCFIYKKDLEDYEKNKKSDPFVITFRKTRTESLIISKIEEISKTRDIQFVISCYYYNNEKSIKGCIYVITSNVLYKIIFIRSSLICKEIHYFNNFITSQNKSIYKKILDFLNKNDYYVKQSHHNEFFTWSHYYLTDNYVTETDKIDFFFKSFV